MARLKTAVLISGSGTNLQALMDATSDPAYPAEIVLVISNVSDAFGLERARRGGIPTRVIVHRDYTNREDFDAALHKALMNAGCELACLAGFMRILTAGFVEKWRGRMINVHPSLLPAFRGLGAQEQALDAGVRIAGATVHFVVPEMDAGPIIVQGAVPVLPGDDIAALSRRIQMVEHRIYPLALRLIAEGRVDIAAPWVNGALGDPDRTLLSPDDRA
jgi:phosphoribosylglycinamide formyltransferase-1